MAEYIEREAVHRLVRSLNKYTWKNPDKSKYRTTVDIDDVQFGIDKIPTADEVEVRHGEWVEDGYNDIPCVCSYCGAEALYNSTFELQFDYDWEENLVPCGYEEHRVYIKTPFCPNCGAKMDGKEIGVIKK